MLTLVLSGPPAQRTHVLTALDRSGISVPVEAQRAINPSHNLPREDGEAWITCHAEHPSVLDKVLERFDWRLRMHYEKPPVPVATRNLVRELDEMHRRLAALERGLAQPTS